MRVGLGRAVIGAAAVVGSIAGVALAGGPATAAPMITCTGAMCVNSGDTPGLGWGQYTCPNGISYPSVAWVPAHGIGWVYPVNCYPYGMPQNPALPPGPNNPLPGQR